MLKRDNEINSRVRETTDSPSSKCDHRHCCVTIKKQGLYGGKYDCFCDQRMWKELNKISKPHFSKLCVSSFLCGLIPSRFYGSCWNLFVVSINGRESAREPHRKEETHNLLKVVQILSHSLVTETIIFPPYKTFYFERFVCNIQCRWFQAWVTCGETICLRKNTDIFLSLNCLYIFFLCWTFIVG